MNEQQPRQLEIPAPDAPAPRCRGCGGKVYPEYYSAYRVNPAGWLCSDCYAEPGDYWARDHATRDKPDSGAVQEGNAEALSPLAQAVRRYAALRVASQPAMKGPRHA